MQIKMTCKTNELGNASKTFTIIEKKHKQKWNLMRIFNNNNRDNGWSNILYYIIYIQNDLTELHIHTITLYKLKMQ